MSDETPSLSTGLFKGLTPEDAKDIRSPACRMPFASSGVRPLNRPVDRDGVSVTIGSSAGQSGGGADGEGPPPLSTGLFKGLTPEDAKDIRSPACRMPFASSGCGPLEQAGRQGWGLVAHRFHRHFAQRRNR